MDLYRINLSVLFINEILEYALVKGTHWWWGALVSEAAGLM